MSRTILGLLSVAVLATIAVAEDAKPVTQLGTDIRVPANIGFSTNVSSDHQSAGLKFDNLYTEVNRTVIGSAGALNQTLTQSKVFTVNIPYSTDQQRVTMHMDLRGYASVDPGATVRLIACVGDATQVIDVTPVKDKVVQLKGTSKEALATMPASEQSGNFESRVVFTVQTQAAKPVCPITLFLLAERSTDKADAGGGLLVIDSLDLEINKATKAAYKP